MRTSMKPDLDQLSDLRHEVERQQGAPLPHVCEGETLIYSKPRRTKVRTQFCGEETKFILPYELIRPAKLKGAEDRGGGFAVLCAHCDGMIAMPRFEAVIREPEPDEGGELDITVEFNEDQE